MPGTHLSPSNKKMTKKEEKKLGCHRPPVGVAAATAGVGRGESEGDGLCEKESGVWARAGLCCLWDRKQSGLVWEKAALC